MAVAFIDFYLVTGDDRVIQLLPQRTYGFGRGDDSDITIQDNLTSRHHCELRWDDASFWSLVDLGSRNGTYCNNQRLSNPSILGDRDVLQVGGQRFTYRLLPPGSDPASLKQESGSTIGAMDTFEVSAKEIMANGEKPAFSGDVPDGDLRKLLRFFSLTNKSGRLDLSTSPGRQVWLVDGVPRRARFDETDGMAALAKLIADPGPLFSFHEGERVAQQEWSIIGERQHLLRDVLGSTDIADLGIDAADLAKAERLQRHLLARIPDIQGYEMGVYYEGKSGVSGDFYDVGMMPNGNVLVVLGDVAGHGVQAAMAVAGMLKTLRSLRQENRELADLLVALNNDLKQDLLPGQFITLFAALLNPVTGDVIMALAGHHHGVLIALDSPEKTKLIGQTGTALGIFEDEQFRKLLNPVKLTLKIGEGIFQCTDGILEAMDKDNNEYGQERIAAAIGGMPVTVTAQQMVDGIVADTKAFAASIEDDLTLLALIRRSATTEVHLTTTSKQKKQSDTDRLPVVTASNPSAATTTKTPNDQSEPKSVITKPLSPALTAALSARDRTQREDSAADPWLGKQLGQVEIICRISQGSMGVVYRGHHRLLDIDVAVKFMIIRDQSTAGLQRKRFLREARAAARIRHPNVVQVLDVGETEDQSIYLTMELVEGPNLGRRLDDHGRMGEQELMTVARGIAEGLAAIHQHDIIHRDMKPDNIMIDPLGVPKISDLGLARMVDEHEARGLTATGIILGTPTHIAPESIRDSTSVDAKSDIYSLGVSLYQLLAGCLPFSGNTIGHLMRAHLSGECIPLRQLMPNANVALCTLIERCMSLEPKKRPTARELATELARIQGQLSMMPAAAVSQGNAVPNLFLRQKKVQATPFFARTTTWIVFAVVLFVVAVSILLIMNRHWLI